MNELFDGSLALPRVKEATQTSGVIIEVLAERSKDD